jgi:hypothetical protein
MIVSFTFRQETTGLLPHERTLGSTRLRASDVHRGCGACDNSARASYQFANARRNSSASLAMLAAIRRASSAREIAKPGRLWPPTAGYGLDRARGPRRSEMPAGASPKPPKHVAEGMVRGLATSRIQETARPRKAALAQLDALASPSRSGSRQALGPRFGSDGMPPRR